MRRWTILVVLATLVLFAVSASAGSLDLVPFARVTASATADTFLGLWPRETDDAPYTVRDGDAETSWKIPSGGPHHLIVDFAPGNRRAPAIERFEADWTEPPAGKVEIAMFDACGGNFVFRSTWSDPAAPLVLKKPVRAQCVVVSVTKPRGAALAGLRVFAAASDAPAIKSAAIQPLDDGWRVTYERANDAVHHVRVGLRAGADASDDLFLVNAPPHGPVDLPRPVVGGLSVVLTPVADDGAAGAEHVLAINPKPDVPFAASGIVEGFYGRPWSHEERRRMILLLARLDQGIYIYGPKNDPLHRDEWRTPYDDAAIERFGELRELGAALGVTMSFGISPGKDMELDDAGERATLVAKLAPFVEVGYRHFTLLFDDIEFGLDTPIDGAMGAAHVELCNWLRGELSALAGEDVALWMVPTVYSDGHVDRFPDGSAYLDAMAGLDPEIEIMWTGTDVFSRVLEAADMVDVTARTGRKPVIWDNEYATDGGDGFVGKIYLAPFLGRGADLTGAVTGIVQNPSIPGSTNRLTLGSVGAYLRDSAGYDPDAAQEDAIRLEATDPWDRALAWEMTRTFYGNGTIGLPGVTFPHNRAMESAIEAMRPAVRSGTREDLTAAAWELLREAARMATTQTRLHHSGLDPLLVDDLWVPSDRLTYEGLALLTMLDWLGARMAGHSGEEFREQIIALNFAALGVRMQLSLFWVEGFWDFLLSTPPAVMGFEAPDIADPASMPAPGEPWRYRANERSSVAWEVFGLDGAYIDDGTLVWTPPHAGTWNAIAIAASRDGWAWKPLTLVVNEPRDDDWSPPVDDDDGGGDDDLAEPEDDDEDDDACGC